MTWHPEKWEKASTVQIRVIPSKEKTVISFHQENLPGPAEMEERKLFF